MLVTSCWHPPFLAIEFVLFGYFLRSLRFGYGTTCNRDGYLPLGRRTATSASASTCRAPGEQLRLTMAARRETAAKLIEAGMSQREAAKALGVGQTQIRRDLMVPAWRTWMRNPMARAAGSRSFKTASVLVALAGLTSTATRVAPGTNSCRSSSRFATSSKIGPRRVAGGAGKAGDQTEPDRVVVNGEDDRDCRGRSFRRQRGSD